MGLKISKSKCAVFARKFKFLGHQFDLDLKGTQIPDKRVESLLNMRVPVSQAEVLSRVSMCNYFSSYLPQHKKVILPLTKMAMSEGFYWRQLEQEAFENLKMLISLRIKNSVIDTTKLLFCCTDCSQISCAFMIFQIDNKGTMQVIATDSRILKSADRKKSASFQELLALMFSILETEQLIRNHNQEVIFISRLCLITIVTQIVNF